MRGILGLLTGALAGALVPWAEVKAPEPAPVAAPSPPASHHPKPHPARPQPPLPPDSKEPDPITRAAYASQRREVLLRWGWPPEPPAGHQQPDEEAVREALGALTFHEVVEVDCSTYPCVAALFGWEEDPDLREAILEHWPHAVVRIGTMGSGRGDEAVRAVTTSVALLTAPVERLSPESLFSHRLAMAMEHRTSQERFDRLHAARTERSSPGTTEGDR